jgi:O-antigen/teichoic acid export membrane protein
MYFFSESGHNFYWVILALMPIPFTLFNTYNSGIFLGKNEISTFNKINWVPSVITFILTYLCIGPLKLHISGSMAAMIGGPLFMFILLMFKNNFIKSFSFKIEWTIIKAMLSLGVIYAISLLVINLNYRVDIIILDKLSNSYEMGIYSKGAGFTQYLWQIPMVLSTIVFARSAVAKDDNGFSLKVAHLLRLSLLAVGMVSAFLFIFSTYVIEIMYGKDFEGSIEILRILLPGVVILTLFKVMNMDLAGKGKPWVAMKAMVPALIINIVINIIFIPKYGGLAASWSSTISYTVAGILFVYFYCLETKMSLKTMFAFNKTDFQPIVKIVKQILKK